MANETPMIIRETSSGYSLYRIQDEMLRNREIECVGEIDADSVYALTRQLRHLEREDPNAEITLLINSPGGSVNSGLALYDVMKSLSCPIRTVCLGTAASMASILFVAGTRRDILPHGCVMIHDPLILRTGGSALKLESISKDLMRFREELCGILAEATGKSLEEIYEKTANDTYFYGQQAVDFGLADRVVTKI